MVANGKSNCCVSPIDAARPTQTQYIDYLADKLREMGLCSRVEYTGSVYDGVKVSNDIEFDIMMIQTENNFKPAQASRPGYYHLEDDSGHQVEPQKKVDEFFSILRKRINNNPDMLCRVLLRNHGPAIQLDVYRDGTDMSRDDKKRVFVPEIILESYSRNYVWFSVDVVLSYEVKVQQQKRLFVSKPLESDPYAWRVSYSLEEKALFKDMDSDNGCRKMVLRMLKVWRNSEVAMHQLTSYNLKTALFHEMKDIDDWGQSELGPRFIGVLRRLYRDMEAGYQPHYFNDQINLLNTINEVTADNIAHRLKRIVTNQDVFNSVFGFSVECARNGYAVESLPIETRYDVHVSDLLLSVLIIIVIAILIQDVIKFYYGHYR